MNYSDIQNRRLRELGAPSEALNQTFTDTAQRNSAFQELERRLTARAAHDLTEFCAGPRRPRILELEEILARTLRGAGFTQVHTPILMARSRLEKMGIHAGSDMEKQVFWLDAKTCLRPMLAPHLYEYMLDLGRILPRPLRLFEVGPCFRRETQGARHGNEFTMLNLVEMGLPEDEKQARLRQLGALVLDAAGIADWNMGPEDSTVYGTADDFTAKDGLELASSAIGPLPMDAAWGIRENWVGIGFGLERLIMAANGESSLSRTGRSLSYLQGIRLHL